MDKSFLLLHANGENSQEGFTAELGKLLKSLGHEVCIPSFQRAVDKQGKPADKSLTKAEAVDWFNEHSDFSSRIEIIEKAMRELRTQSKQVNIVGFSLGSASFTHWLGNKLNNRDRVSQAVLLGYLPNIANTKALSKTPTTIFQGEHDYFGSPDEVKSHFAEHKTPSKVVPVKSAGHRMNDMENGNDAELQAMVRQQILELFGLAKGKSNND